ncbi:MAG: hypothetical protein QM796_00755 [Chthoniobacteraceae bacterium]
MNTTLPFFILLTGGQSTPLGDMAFAILVCMFPWGFQYSQRKQSRMGSSPLEDENERFWLIVGLVLSVLIATGFLLGKYEGKFHSWINW